MTHREGRAEVIGTIWFPTLHKGITEEMLSEVLGYTSGGRVLHVQIFRNQLDEGDHAQSRSNYARADLEGLKAKEKVLQKSKKGSLVVNVNGQVMYLKAQDKYEIPDKINKETKIFQVACSLATCITMEEDKVEVFQRIDRDGQLPISFNFKEGSISFLFADARRNGIVYKYLVLLRDLVKIRLWADPQSPEDALLLLHITKRPYVWFANLSSNPQLAAPADPFRNFAINGPDDKGFIFQTDDLVRALQDEPEKFTRLSTGGFYDDAMLNPMQCCDSLVFRFKKRARKLGTWPLLGLLASQCPYLLEKGFSVGHSWSQTVRPFKNAARKNPEAIFQDFHSLPTTVKWGAMNLITNDHISPRGFLEELNSHIRSRLAALGDDNDEVACALESMSGQSRGQKIWNSAIESSFRASVEQAASYGGPAWSDSEGYLVPQLIVTPTRVIASTLQVAESNRMLCHFAPLLPPGSLIRIRFLDEGFRPLHSRKQDGRFLVLFMQKILLSGLTCFGQKLDFIFFSQSQLRETSCWMLDRTTGHSITAEAIRNWLGRPDDYFSPSNCASRLGLSLSQTRQGSDQIEESTVVVKQDILTTCRSYCFTDGCGNISASLAESVALRLELEQVPSAFQVRFRGAKGMLLQSAMEDGKDILLRESMIKYQRDGPAVLEVCGWSTFRPAYINREIINLLWALRIDEKVFYRLQDAFLEDLRLLVSDSSVAANLLRQEYLSGGDRIWQTEIAAMLSAGLPVTEPFIRSSLQSMRRLHLEEVRTKARLLVKKGALLFGVADPAGVLAEDEVVVTLYRRGNTAGEWNTEQISGRVVVTRNPCLHPGDIRVVKAVRAPPELSHLTNVVVFPTRGSRPLPSQMSGGDLDGDQFSVYWDTRLIPKETFPALPYISPSREPGDRVTLEDLVDHFSAFPLHDSVGVISNAHKAWASINAPLGGARSKECLELAELAAISVDFPKTGIAARMRGHLHRQSMPEFMENTTKPSIKTTCPLAKLWENVVARDKEEMPGRETAEGVVDERFIVEGHERFLAEAHSIFKKYCAELSATMTHFGLTSDAVAISGTATAVSDIHRHDRNLADKLQRRVKQIRSKYNSIFWKLEDESEGLESHIQKLSAWYRVAYEQEGQMFRSFAWLAPEVMLAKGGLIGRGFRVQFPVEEYIDAKDAHGSDQQPGETNNKGGTRGQSGGKKKSKSKGRTIVIAGMRR